MTTPPMPPNDLSAPFSRPVPLTKLRRARRMEVDETATAEERAAIAAALDLIEAPKLTVTGEITPKGRDGWLFTGEVRAKVVQACVVTLQPVAATVVEPIERAYTEDADRAPKHELDFDPDGDDPPDYAAHAIDVGAAAVEALTLGLDPYPRAPGAAFDGAEARPPGAEPIRDVETRAFAGLAALRKTMEDGD